MRTAYGLKADGQPDPYEAARILINNKVDAYARVHQPQVECTPEVKEQMETMCEVDLDNDNIICEVIFWLRDKADDNTYHYFRGQFAKELKVLRNLDLDYMWKSSRLKLSLYVEDEARVAAIAPDTFMRKTPGGQANHTWVVKPLPKTTRWSFIRQLSHNLWDRRIVIGCPVGKDASTAHMSVKFYALELMKAEIASQMEYSPGSDSPFEEGEDRVAANLSLIHI